MRRLSFLSTLLLASTLSGATDLTLAPGLSFTDDSSVNFPIRGKNLDDGRVASDRPTVVFFGTSHCWNTNREAERFVTFYARHREEARYVVVDLDHPSAAQKSLVQTLYHGYIPTLAFVDQAGKVIYNEAGESSRIRGDIRKLEEILKRASESLPRI